MFANNLTEMSKLNNHTDRLQISCTNAKFGRRFGNDSQTVDANAARRRRASRGIYAASIAVAPVRASADRCSSVCHAFRGIRVMRLLAELPQGPNQGEGVLGIWGTVRMHTGRYAAHVSDSRESRNCLMRIPI